MAGSVADRLGYVAAALARSPSIRPVGWMDAVWQAVSWYGARRRAIRRRMSATPLEPGFQYVALPDRARTAAAAGGGQAQNDTVARFGLAWPDAAPLSRLAAALVEIWAPTNPHYYFAPPTAVRPGDEVLDVGACEGAFGLECLSRYGAARVFCFEPEPTMARSLRLTARQNGLQRRLEVVEAAVSSRPGRVSVLSRPGDPLASVVLESVPDSSQRDASQVEQLTLDGWLERTPQLSRVDYLKIDAEGSDLAVLEGATTLLKRFRPRIAVTTYHRPEHCRLALELVRSLDLGYRCRVKGLMSFGGVPRPVMLHAAVPRETPA